MNPDLIKKRFIAWRKDWNLFASEMLQVNLDIEQQKILSSCQYNSRTSVASGTARGKDFVSAVAALCFLYLTPKWDKKGNLIENTKVALTAPTDRQVKNIMVPEFSRLFKKARYLPGRLVGYDIRTSEEEWFLTGFKADENTTEAWSGFHAVNTMFIITEASGMPQTVFDAIEGNLQGNSRILLVFNPNTSIGYAANSQKEPGWNKFRLDSLDAPNVLNKNNAIPGQVDYPWVKDKVERWCTSISESDYLEAEGDFHFKIDDQKKLYRPNDLFRIKVRGLFPKVSEDVLIPLYWVQLANERWKKGKRESDHLRLGVDVAGMGRDSTEFVFRYGNRVDKIESMQSGGEAKHMEIAGKTINYIRKGGKAFIDTIGEGAGVYSRTQELGEENAYSVKFSEKAEWEDELLRDVTDVYEFINMRAYLYWALRDWLNPANNTGAQLPPDDQLTQELTEIKYKFKSNGRIQIEAKEDIQKRIKRSPDKSDGLANTFYPVPDVTPKEQTASEAASYFR
ncbi:MAG TPA: hypothetical protein VIQ00_09390 [Chitinophagaceae bacterium]